MKKLLLLSLIFFSLSSYAQDTIRIKFSGNSSLGSSQWNVSGNNIYNNLPGNVGIGTTNLNDPGFKLFVETGIRTRKIKVDQTAWPDYVFEKDYELLPLPQLAAYINEKKHLPDVPSACEVEKNGINLGDNQSVLLKKLEENTLYIIQLNAESEKLEKIIEEQQEKMDQQTKELAELKARLDKS